jgi:hypothetical protein
MADQSPLTAEQLIEKLQTMTELDEINAIIENDSRVTVQRAAEARLNDLLQSTPITPSASATPPNTTSSDNNAPAGLKFALLKGAPRMMTLRPSGRRHDDLLNTTVLVPGVTWHAVPVLGDPGVRMLDCMQAQETKRADYPVKPEELAAMIRQTTYYRNGLIIEWAEYEELRAFDRERQAKMQQMDEEFKAKRAARAGKRGA